jgi:hypothetical protein
MNPAARAAPQPCTGVHQANNEQAWALWLRPKIPLSNPQNRKTPLQRSPLPTDENFIVDGKSTFGGRSTAMHRPMS